MSRRHLLPFFTAACLTLSACSVTAPSPSGTVQRMLAVNGMSVRADSAVPGQFEVLYYPGAAALDYWCAAGDYIYRGGLGARDSRIYLVAPLGAGQGGRSVTFTVLPDAALVQAGDARPKGDYSLTITRPGENYRPTHVRQTCRPVLQQWGILGD